MNGCSAHQKDSKPSLLGLPGHEADVDVIRGQRNGDADVHGLESSWRSDAATWEMARLPVSMSRPIGMKPWIIPP